MCPLTRRRALHGATALLAGLAGCGDDDRRHDPPTTRPRPEHVETDPPHRFVRNPADEPVVGFDSSGETSTGAGEGRPDDVTMKELGRALVTSRQRADALEFAPGAEGVEAARTFLDETDFDRETIYVLQQNVGECYRLELCYVSWEAGRIDVQFAGEYRDADVACDVNSRDRLAAFIRLPAVLDPDDYTSFGGGTSGSGCHTPRGWETESPDGSDSS